MKLVGTTPQGEQIVIIAQPLSQRLTPAALEKLGEFVGALPEAPAGCALGIPDAGRVSDPARKQSATPRRCEGKAQGAKRSRVTKVCKVCKADFHPVTREGGRVLPLDGG
jgi:hypothetical protein